MEESSSQKEFSYMSNEKKIKKISGVFLLEVIAVVITGILILVLLNYLNVFDLRRMSSGLSLLPSKDKFRDNTVMVKSEIPGITVSIKDKERFLNDLKEWGVIGGTFKGGYGLQGSTLNTSVKDVSIILTDQEQQINQYIDKEGKVYLSSISRMSPGKVEFTIHIAPSIFNDNVKKKVIGSYFETQLMTTAYRLVNPPRQRAQYEASEKAFVDYLVQKNKEKRKYFDVQSR